MPDARATLGSDACNGLTRGQTWIARSLTGPGRAGRPSPLPRPYRRAIGYVVAVGGVAVTAAAFHPFRSWISPVSVGFTFLVAVVLAAAIGGFGPGVLASVLGFFTFNFLFLPPFDTFRVARPEYVVVLFVFLGLSVLVSGLLARARDRAEAAEAREAEIRMLFELSRDLVARLPGPEMYEATLHRLVKEFGYSAAALHVQEATAFHGLREQVTVGAPTGSIPAQWSPAEEQPPERLPLAVGGRVLGLIVLSGDRPPLTTAETRVLRAFCDQFALILERDRLLRAATEADLYRQSEGLRRSMLAAVSHDLRSPLSAIKASVTDLLAEDASRDPGYVAETLDAIRRRPSGSRT